MDNLGHDGECIEQALCRWWMSTNTHPHHKAHKVKLGFDQLDCPGLFGTLMDKYPDLDPQKDEAVAGAEPLLGLSSDPRYDGDNCETLGVTSQLWKEECFCEVEETLDRGMTALLMNLATLISNMDDLGDLVESMHIPRQIAPQLVSTYKLCSKCIHHAATTCWWFGTGLR